MVLVRSRPRPCMKSHETETRKVSVLRVFAPRPPTSGQKACPQARHLPDEICEICGGEFRPAAFHHHWEGCDGVERGEAAGKRHVVYRFWLEVSGVHGGKPGVRNMQAMLVLSSWLLTSGY